jgi:RNAse (barnase) inhibitor barstar
VTTHGSLDLAHASDGGVYFVDTPDFEALAVAANQAKLTAYHVDLAGCLDKAELLRRIARALTLRADFGSNWDALLDGLRDAGQSPEHGLALLLDHAVDFRRAAPSDFEALVGILSDAGHFAMKQDRPFFAFIKLPDHVIKHSSRI